MAIGNHLNTLEASGLIRLAQVAPDLEYLFRHSLVQEVAYDSLLKTDRQKLHLAVGTALEKIYPERRAELAPILAHHFYAAGEDQKAQDPVPLLIHLYTSIGLGRRSVNWVLGALVINHINNMAGEMSCLKGLQGAKGYPF